MSSMINYKDNALLFKAFSDDNRLKILEILKGGEVCACDILEKLNIVQSTLSHHMKILYDVKIVNARKDGKWTYYSFNEDTFHHVQNILIYYLSKDNNYTNHRECN